MAVTTLVLIVYLIIIALITYLSYSKIKSFADFFNAGKRGNLATISGSLIATILGGSAIIGTVNEGPVLGWATAWYMLCASFGLIVLIPFAGKVNKLGKYSLPDLLGTMYAPRVKLISSWIIAIAWIGIVAAQVIAAARILQSFTGMSYETGVILTGFIFIIYTMAGGQLSVLKTDLFQSILIVVGLGIIAFYSSKTACKPVIYENPMGFPFNKNFSPVDLLVLIITYATTFTFGPDIYTRIFCARSEKTAKYALAITSIVLIPVAFSIAYISVTGVQCLQLPASGSYLIEICKSILPGWAVAIIVVSLLSAVLSSADTTILSASIIITDIVEKGNFGIKTIKISRGIIFLIGIASILISLNFTSIIGILLIALTAYSGAFILPLLAGLIGVTCKPAALTAAIISGGAVALTGKIIFYTGHTSIGNVLIIVSFIINGVILFLGTKKPHRSMRLR